MSLNLFKINKTPLAQIKENNMKRILSISILLFLFACEEDKADETANESVNNTLDGTYKQPSNDWYDCGDGTMDIQYLTVDGLKVINWDYDADCAGDWDDCYYKESFNATKDGDALNVDLGDDLGNIVITRSGTNSLKIDYLDFFEYSELWPYESSKIKTYSPNCSDN